MATLPECCPRILFCTRLTGYPAVCELRQATRGYGRLGDVLEGLKAGTAVAFSWAAECLRMGDQTKKLPMKRLDYSYGHLLVITGYFYGIIHSINGVSS